MTLICVSASRTIVDPRLLNLDVFEAGLERSLGKVTVERLTKCTPPFSRTPIHILWLYLDGQGGPGTSAGHLARPRPLVRATQVHKVARSFT